MSSSTDPRERVIQLGNELLDATFEYSKAREAALALKRRTEQSHHLGDYDIRTVLLPLLEAEQRTKAAHDAYITAGSIVELYDDAGAKR